MLPISLYIAPELRSTIHTLLAPLISSNPSLADQDTWLIKTVADSIESVDGWESRFLATGLLEVPEVPDADLERVVKALGLGEERSVAVRKGWRDAVEVSVDLSVCRGAGQTC